MAQASRISIKALLVGMVVQLLGLILLAGVGGFYVGVHSRPGDTFSEKSFESIEPRVLLGLIFLGLCVTTIGGYVAAMIAKRSHLLHGAIVSGLTSLWLLSGLPTEPLWYWMLSWLGSISFGILGGMLATPMERASSST